jgi:hypothetical protein
MAANLDFTIHCFFDLPDDQQRPFMQPINPYAPPEIAQNVEPLPAGSGFGAVLNNGLRLFATNLLSIALITVIVWGPLEIFEAYMEYFVFDEDDFRSMLRLHQGLDSLFGIVVTAGVIELGAATIRGDRLSAGSGLSKGLAAWPRMFWTRLVSRLLLLIAFLALFLPFIYLVFRIAVIDQVAVLEHSSGGSCIKRTYELTTRKFWAMAGLTVLPYSFVMVFSIALFVPFVLFPEIDHWLVSAAVSVVVDVLLQIPTLIMVAAYFSLLPVRESRLDQQAS